MRWHRVRWLPLLCGLLLVGACDRRADPAGERGTNAPTVTTLPAPPPLGELFAAVRAGDTKRFRACFSARSRVLLERLMRRTLLGPMQPHPRQPTGHAGTRRPSTSRPSTSRPSTSRPSTGRPSTSRRSTSRPGTSRPTSGPSINRPTSRPTEGANLRAPTRLGSEDELREAGWRVLLQIHRRVPRPLVRGIRRDGADRMRVTLGSVDRPSIVTLVREQGRWRVDLTSHREIAALEGALRSLRPVLKRP